MPLLCTISLVANDSPESNAGKHLKRETSTVLDRFGKKNKASLVFGGSIHQGTNAGSLNELLDVGYVHKKVFCVHKILKDDVNPATCLC